MNVRFQKTARGEVAILPRKEYEALLAKADEDAGTARLVARARSEIAAGAPLLPKHVVDRLATGENPVRVVREWRDVTQLYLSFKTNLSQGYNIGCRNRAAEGGGSRASPHRRCAQCPTRSSRLSLIRPCACVTADVHARRTPPVRLPTSATIFAASASISASVMVRSRGCSLTAIAIDFLPGAMPAPS